MAGFPSFCCLIIFHFVCLCTHVYTHTHTLQFLYHSPVNGHINILHVLAIVNIVAVNMEVQPSLQDSNFISFRYIQRSGMAGLYGSSSVNFLRNLHAVFQSGCTNLHFLRQCTMILFSPHLCQHLLRLVFL